MRHAKYLTMYIDCKVFRLFGLLFQIACMQAYFHTVQETLVDKLSGQYIADFGEIWN